MSLFTFNAFAVPGFEIPGFGAIPDKIVMGDGIIDAVSGLGLERNAPDFIHAHEFAHHVQFELGAIQPYGDPEQDRRAELMADAFGAYYAAHARGASFQNSRVVDLTLASGSVGDCAFDQPGHHGTPNQRAAAAEWGLTLAGSARPQGKILSATVLLELFDADLPHLVAPDAGCTQGVAVAGSAVISGGGDHLAAARRTGGLNRGASLLFGVGSAMADLMLSRVPAVVVEEMYQAGVTRSLDAGQTLYDDGLGSRTVFVIIAGVVKLLVYSPGGKLALIALRGVGELVGQHGALDGRPRSSGAQALVQCELLSITSERFRQLLRAHPDLAMATMSGLSHQIRDALRHIAELNGEQAPVLVARRLLQLALNPKLEPLRIVTAESIMIRSSLSQRDLAAWAGVSERSAGTVLHEFRDRGLIATGRLRIEIRDINGLRRVAGIPR